MVSKEEAVKKLKAAGYVAKLEKGVVMVYYKDKTDYEETKNNVYTFLKDKIGYEGSFGINPIEGKIVVKDEEN